MSGRSWVYVDGSVDLTRPAIRKAMVGEARWLHDTCGFDGVQWDYEPAPEGGRGLLNLLDDTRRDAPDLFLSVASPVWYPWPLSGLG